MRQPAYVLGTLGFEHKDMASRLHFAHEIGGRNPNDPESLLNYFEQKPWRAPAVNWLLMQGKNVPRYAILPGGPYKEKAYELLVEFYREQYQGAVDRVAIGGILHNDIRVKSSGGEVPVIMPNLGCMSSWTTGALFDAVSGERPAEDAPAQELEDYFRREGAVTDFLNRLYYNEAVNSGVAPEDMAINYAVTNIASAYEIITDALRSDYRLDAIRVEPCRISRPESMCMIVNMKFFHPEPLRSGREYQFTVELGGPCPVILDEVRSWSIR
jgi:hypothetical protein